MDENEESEEDFMDEREDNEDDCMGEKEDIDPAAAAHEDPTDEGEDFDEMGENDDDWECELEADEKITPVTVLRCAAQVSMVGIGILMTL